MRETRRSLKAENIQLRAQLEAQGHTTRSSLHDHLKGIKDRNEDLVKTIKALQDKNASLEAELVLVKAGQPA